MMHAVLSALLVAGIRSFYVRIGLVGPIQHSESKKRRLSLLINITTGGSAPPAHFSIVK